MRAKIMDLRYDDNKNIVLYQCVARNVCKYIVKLDTCNKLMTVVSELFDLDTLVEEKVVMVCTNAALKPIAFFDLGKGTSTSCLVNAKGIFQRALMCGADNFFVVHNHPSGEVTPSKEDVRATDKLKELGEMLGIRLLDHLIIGKEERKLRGYSLIHNHFF